MTYRKTHIRRIITKNVNVVINDVKKTSFMEYTDVMFLYTLNHAKKAVKMIADKWLSESFWEISQKRIYIGCVREEMKELQKGAA